MGALPPDFPIGQLTMLEQFIQNILDDPSVLRYQRARVIAGRTLGFLFEGDPFLNTVEVCHRFPFWQPDHLKAARGRGRGLPYYKLGDESNSRVLYRLQDITDYLAKCKRTP